MRKEFHCQILVALIRNVLHLIFPKGRLEFQFMIYHMTAKSINPKIGLQALYYVTERSQYPLKALCAPKQICTICESEMFLACTESRIPISALSSPEPGHPAYTDYATSTEGNTTENNK
jgi:hypothetical protein